MISVAMCTFNGERFLQEQLESIFSQSRLPDEMVVCDDHSSDGTVEILREFAARVPFRVRVQVNEANLGSSQNFSEAMRSCEGDVICLSDQDDVWEKSRLETLERSLLSRDNAGFAFSDALIVDQSLNPLGYRLFDVVRFPAAERRRFNEGHAFSHLLRRWRVTGATMAFRSRWKDLVLPVPRDWVHDEWIALLVSAFSSCIVLDEPLVRYRQHHSQQIGEKKLGFYDQFRLARRRTKETFEAAVRRYEMALDRLRAAGCDADKLKMLAEKIAHADKRARMRETRFRLPHIAGEIWAGNYSRYSLGWASIAADLLL